MCKLVPFIFHAIIVLLLTLLTQIGGLAYIVALLVTRRWRDDGDLCGRVPQF